MIKIDWSLWIAFILPAFLLPLITTPLIKKLAWRYQWFDRPDDRKIHKYPTPRLGGIGIFGSFLIISAIVILRNWVLYEDGDPKIILFLAGCLIIFLLGIVDDLSGLGVREKFTVQILAGLIAYGAGFQLTTLRLPFLGTEDIGLAGILLTLLWIAGVSNAINLIDGLNGLAGGVSAIASFFVGIVALSNGDSETAILSWILMASIAGFLPYNLRDGRIFMGDSGSLFIGYALSLLSISAAAHSEGGVSLLIPVAILCYPIMDTFLALIRRMVRGRGLFSGDLGHIHHRLLSRLLCPKKTVTALCAVSAVLGLVALLISNEVKYLSNIIAVVIVFTAAVSMVSYGNAELREAYHGRFNLGRRRRTPWYKNRIVNRVTRRIYNAGNLKHICRLIAVAGRELEADLIGLELMLKMEDGSTGVVRYKWPLRKSGSNGDSLWVTRYPLRLSGQFDGSLVYEKAEWKRRRNSEEDEIWVTEIGRSVNDWLVRAIEGGNIKLKDVDSEVAAPEIATA